MDGRKLFIYQDGEEIQIIKAENYKDADTKLQQLERSHWSLLGIMDPRRTAQRFDLEKISPKKKKATRLRRVAI